MKVTIEFEAGVTKDVLIFEHSNAPADGVLVQMKLRVTSSLDTSEVGWRIQEVFDDSALKISSILKKLDK